MTDLIAKGLYSTTDTPIMEGPPVKAGQPMPNGKLATTDMKVTQNGITRTYTLNNGQMLSFNYGLEPLPVFTHNQDMSWLEDPSQTGNSVRGPIDTNPQLAEEWRKLEKDELAAQGKPVRLADGSYVTIQQETDPATGQTHPVGTPVVGPNGEPIGGGPKIHTWTVQQINGAYFYFDSATSQTVPMTDAQGNPVTDPTVAAKKEQELRQGEASLTATNVQTRAAANTDARANFNVADKSYYDDLNMRLSLGKISADQAIAAWNSYKELNVDLPRQATQDANNARTNTINAASTQQSSNLSRESYAQAGGNNAVSDAQWMASHGVGAGFHADLAAAARDPANFRPTATALPMPDFQSIRAAGEQGVRNQVPSFQQTLGATAPYQSFQPDLAAAHAFYNTQVAPAQMFGVPLPYAGYGAAPPPSSMASAPSLLSQVHPWYGDPNQMPPQWGMGRATMGPPQWNGYSPYGG